MNAIEWFISLPVRFVLRYTPVPDVLAPLAVSLLGAGFLLLSFDLYERYLDLKLGKY